MYDKDFYEGEQNLRDDMLRAERNIRAKNKNATDENIDILVDEYMEQEKVNRDIDDDAYNLDDLTESFYDGVDINGQMEMDYDEYNDYN
jgi:hypothetical protein